MTSLSDRLDESLLDLLWSLWAEMGVSGWLRRHAEIGIDPEPLILCTAAIHEADPRLNDEAIDWSIRYGRYISGVRLRNLLRSEPPQVQAAFGTFAATVSAHGGPSWQSATSPRPYRPRKRSSIDHFDRAALLSLRLRGLLGVTARAELLRIFVGDPSGSYTASELAVQAAYTRRSVADALEAFTMSGIVHASSRKNHLVYELADPMWLLDLVGRRPLVFPRWSPLFRLLREVRQAARLIESTTSSHVRAIETHNLLQAIGPFLESANLAEPSVPAPSGTTWDIWPELEAWILGLADAVASGDAGRYLTVMPRQRQMPVTFLERIQHLAVISPAAAVVEAVLQVEMVVRAGLTRSARGNVESIETTSLDRLAVRNGLLSEQEAKALSSLLELRNRAVHGAGAGVDSEEALEAGRLAYQLIVAVELAQGRTISAG